jgi:hypothetical protein
MLHRASELDGFFGMTLSTSTVTENSSKHISNYKLDLVGVQKVRKDKSGNKPDDHILSDGNGNVIT